MSIYNTAQHRIYCCNRTGLPAFEVPRNWRVMSKPVTDKKNLSLQPIFRAGLELIIDSARMTRFRFVRLRSWGWSQFCCAFYCKLMARLRIFRANRLAWLYRRVTNNLGASSLIITYITKKQGPWNYWKICVLPHDMHWRGTSLRLSKL